MRSKTKVKNSVGPLLNDNGELVSNDQEMAEMLTHILPRFLHERTVTISQQLKMYSVRINLRLSSFTIDSNAVKDKLCKLKNNKAPGIDSVSSKMLIEIADEISVFLTELYNKSLKTGDVPEDWKLANVTPIFKKGKRSNSDL